MELMRDDADYLCLSHIMTRRLVGREHRMNEKAESFYRFIRNLARKGKPLRVLIIGANSDGEIPKAEEEARELESQMKSELKCMGMTEDTITLTGSDLTLDNVRSILASGCHILHYAGHGLYAEEKPESSALVLGTSYEEVLDATKLSRLLADTELRFVFLSCCLGACNSFENTQSDFRGILSAMAMAGVPRILAQRWVLFDESALYFARSFYRSLWSSLSPDRALWEARNRVHGELGRDDATWLSPLLLSQSY